MAVCEVGARGAGAAKSLLYMWRVIVISVAGGVILVGVSLATAIVYVHDPPVPDWAHPVFVIGGFLIVWPFVYGLYAICAAVYLWWRRRR